jgi:HK97 family phage prohead protease
MPYFIEKVPTGWNTIKDDGEVLGQHKTKAQAIAQMVAVSLAEGIAVGGERAVDPDESFSPPAGVAVAAKRALQWIADGLAGDGFTDVGRARAVQLASGADISGETVNRMISFFARMEDSVKGAEGFNSGEEGYPSFGRVSWDAWGGDSGQTWVNGLSSVSAVRAIGDQVGISDFDDTLFVDGGLNSRVYSFIESQDVDLYVVTGRHESDRGLTTDLLDKLGIEYEKLIMQPDDQDDSANYKGNVASGLLAEGLDVVYVVENNAEARAAYKTAGVQQVYSPDDLPLVDGVRQMEDYPMTKDDLVYKVNELKGEVLELVGKLAKTVDDLSELVESVEVPAVDVVDVVDVVEPSDLMPSEMEMDSVRFVDPLKVVELHERGERVQSGIEQRIAVQDLEIRAEGNGMTLRGYAAVFNSPSQPLPFIETIERGAFADSLKSRNDVKLLWNHDTSTVLGSTRAGTLRLMEDERGLLVEADLPDTQAGRDAATLIQRGDVTAFSFGFRIPAGGDVWRSANERVLKRVNVHEVSVGVAFPAYTATDGTANVRSMNELSEKIIRLAELRGISADELTDALLALEAGDELTERQGELLTNTLGKVLKKDPEVSNANDVLDLKKKQLDLLMQRV